jgi:hypothetical protein
MAKSPSLFIPDVLMYAPACPDFTIEQHILSAAIKFCEDSKAYQVEMDPISSVTGIGEYDLEPPTGTTVESIHSVKFNGIPLTPVSTRGMDDRVPKRTTYNGTPKYYLKNSSTTLLLGPTPSSSITNGIQIRLVLKPKRTVTTLPDELYDDFYEAILRLALYRILSVPRKDWTDKVAAREQMALYQDELRRAKLRSRQAEGGSVPIVRYGGL